METTNKKLNRAKIKDMMAIVCKRIDPNYGLGLWRLENLATIEKQALKQARDEDLNRIEKMFIKSELGIEYYPLQNKKEIRIKGESKIVPLNHPIDHKLNSIETNIINQ